MILQLPAPHLMALMAHQRKDVRKKPVSNASKSGVDHPDPIARSALDSKIAIESPAFLSPSLDLSRQHRDIARSLRTD